LNAGHIEIANYAYRAWRGVDAATMKYDFSRRLAADVTEDIKECR
jgi:hypothetical protein